MESDFGDGDTNATAAGKLALLHAHVWQVVGGLLDLSPREAQIVRGIFEDKKELTIAGELGISRGTVHTYLERIYHKLSVSSRVGVVVRVFAEYVAANGNNHKRNSMRKATTQSISSSKLT